MSLHLFSSNYSTVKEDCLSAFQRKLKRIPSKESATDKYIKIKFISQVKEKPFKKGFSLTILPSLVSSFLFYVRLLLPYNL
jgi:hypothetical protein